MGKYLPGMGDDFDWYNPFDYPGAIVSSALDVGGIVNDAVRGDIMGDVNYDRDYTADDAIELGSTLLILLLFSKVLVQLRKVQRGQ